MTVKNCTAREFRDVEKEVEVVEVEETERWNSKPCARDLKLKPTRGLGDSAGAEYDDYQPGMYLH